MPYLVKILIERKPGVLNPEAKIIQNAARQIGYDVANFEYGKYFSYASKQKTREKAEEEARELSGKLLANPVIENFKIVSIEETKQFL